MVYVDNDPLCCTHGRALLARHAGVQYVQADLTRPRNVLSETADHLERDRPLAVILSSVLHHVPEELDPARIVRGYTEILPPGSYIALNHYLDPADNPVAHRLARELENRFVHGLGSGWFRPRERIAALFDGLELVEPGLVELGDWWPHGPALRPRSPEERLMLGGLGRIPALENQCTAISGDARDHAAGPATAYREAGGTPVRFPLSHAQPENAGARPATLGARAEPRHQPARPAPTARRELAVSTTRRPPRHILQQTHPIHGNPNTAT